MRNSAGHATALEGVSRFLHILETDNATMRKTHRGTGQDVPDNVTRSPNVNTLDGRQLSPHVNPLDTSKIGPKTTPTHDSNAGLKTTRINRSTFERDTGQRSRAAQKRTCRNLGQG